MPKINATIFFLIFLFFSLLTSHFSLLFAASPSKQLSIIEKKIKKKKQQVQETIEQEKSVLSELESINQSIKQRQKELRDYEKRISEAQLQIKALEDEIVSINGRIGQRREDLKGRLRVLYKQQYGGKALILISAEDYQDLIKKGRYMSLLTYQDRRLINELSDEINEADAKKKELEHMRRKLEASRASVQGKKKELESEHARKDRLLASVRSKRSSYENMLKELEDSSVKLREMIERLEREKRGEPYAGKGFRSLRGRLGWPVDGEVVVSFGKYNDPQYNIPVFKNGIEIKADAEEEPRAVTDGRVVFADWFKGYGLLLIIDHGNGYHTLYGHLSEIFHKSGDIIKKGAVLGKIGESGLLNVPTLYFEIRYKGKPVDPLHWLKKTGRENSR